MARKSLKRTLNTSAFLLILPLALLLSFTVLSCGDDDQSGLTVGIVYDAEGKGDKSFNDSAYEGTKRAQEELGAVVSEENDRRNGVAPRGTDPVSRYADNDLVIAVGFFI